ncbi:MAG TPA: T9SS type A sorting domain-containing protein, partial [Cryomorphaceae bacterium]|nr:T9SS type A sorting domain-containing protein [Cryomorphaceae bacterium]
FPAVDIESLSSTIQENSVLIEWEAVEGQIGCQLQLRFANGPVIETGVVLGEFVSSKIIPGSLLDYSTDYEWRVRCGCSVDPLVVGPVSPWQPFSTPGAGISSMPNPTQGLSNVTFSVVEEGYTTLEVYDMSGRLIDAVFTGVAQPNGEYRFEFDGSALPNGVYIYRLTTQSEVLNNKFMIAK